MLEAINNYLKDISEVVSKVPADDVARIHDIIYDAYKNNQRVFIFGNGGGASTASHMVCDLAKGTVFPNRKRLKAISLSDNVPLLTAWANDTYYSNTFGEQLHNLIEAGDVVIGLSGSGQSPNVINALEVANRAGATSVLFSGFDGGKARHVAQHCILVPSQNMQQIEDVHMILAHVVFTCLRKKIQEEGED